MALSIASKAVNMGATSYYEEEWHLLIETHLPLLSNDPNASVLSVSDHDAYRYEGDLTGLLLSKKVEPQYHFIVMRLNGLRSPQEYSATMTTLILPNTQRIEALRKAYMTISNKTN